VRGCACRGTMGLAHLSCLVRQAEVAMKEKEELNTGEGLLKWQKCFDCGQGFHGAVCLALGWGAWKTYLGRKDTDGYRCISMALLGGALRMSSRLEEALPVLEAHSVLVRRYWSHDEENILCSQGSIASCLANLGRHDESLVLKREVFAKFVALLGATHERTILTGANLTVSLNQRKLFGETKTLVRDKLLPAARRSLGADHDLTLKLNQNLSAALQLSPEHTRDDLLEAQTIMQDVIQRRRRVFGPAHPNTLRAEAAEATLSRMRQVQRRRPAFESTPSVEARDLISTQATIYLKPRPPCRT